MSELNCTLADISIYPVKSCAGISVRQARVIETGLDLDRDWMVVDEHGEMLSQRECPRLALVQPSLRHTDLMLRAPGMLALHLSLEAVEGPTRVRIWDDVVKAYDMGPLAAQWFSDFLSLRGTRLVRFDPEQQRLSDPKWTAGVRAENAFSDGFPLLVTTTDSLGEINRRLREAGQPAVDLRRFRPNLVLDGLGRAHAEDTIETLAIDSDDGPVVIKLVKPCVRCTIPDVDPATGSQGAAVAEVLRGYRADARVGGGLSFGMNAVVVSGVNRTLTAGAQAVARVKP